MYFRYRLIFRKFVRLEIKKLKNDDSIVYGPDIKGVDMDNMWSLRTKYTPLFSTPEKARKNIKNGEITD